MKHELLHKAADAFVDAAFDPPEWPHALQQLAEAAGATGMLLLPVEGRVPGVPFTDSIGDLVEFYFKHGWHVHDQRGQGVPLMVRSGIMVDQDMIAPDAMNRNRYYQELLRPFGFQWFAGLGFQAGPEIWCAAFQRTLSQGPFTKDETRTLLRIGSRLTTAATLARRFGLARIEGMTAAFEALDCALILVDRAGHVVLANPEAENHIRATLPVVNGDFVLNNTDEQAALMRHIAVATRNAPESDVAHLDPVIVSREGRRPLVLRAVPLPRKMFHHFSSAAVIILIIDPEEQLRTPELFLRGLFGLTKTEAALAASLADGGSVSDYGDCHELSAGSARQLAKQVLSKTDTHRQSDLVSLILRYRLPPGN